MTQTLLSRRRLLAGAAFAATAQHLQAATSDFAAPDLVQVPHVYEVRRTEAEWRAALSEAEYAILRGGQTEFPTTSPLWNDYTAGNFACRGCGLHLYCSADRAPIEKGWVFFYHSQPDAVLTGIDRGNPYAMAEGSRQALIEVHCRRCASHLGHVLLVDGELVHCINGTSLHRTPVNV